MPTTKTARILVLAALAAALIAAAPTKPLRSSVTRATLANGMRVVIVRDPLAPVATVVMNYRVGSDETPAGFPGTAHAQEHMMFRGSPGLSKGQLAEITADMGGDFNADTQNTVTQYFYTVPAEDLNLALRITAIRAGGVDDSAKEWAQERGAIEQEVAADLSNPTYVFYTKLLKIMFGGTPYAQDALGTRPSFDRTTAAALQHFYSDWYAPNNAILIVSGDIAPQAALAEIRKLFNPLPARRLPQRPAVQLRPIKAQRLQLKTDLPYGFSAIAFRLPGSDSPDYAAANVLADVLSSQRGSLFALTPEGKALFAGFELANSLPKASLGFALGAFPKGGNGELLLSQVRGVLAADLKNGLPPELVAAAKAHELADAEFQRNSISGLAFLWSNALAVEGRHSPEDDIRAIERVTPADVNRVARKYLNFNEAVEAILTPQVSGKPITRKSFGGLENMSPTHVKAVVLPAWAQKALGTLRIPAWKLKPVVHRLPNGLRLIVVPETISNTVSVYGRIKTNSDLEQAPHQEGAADVLDQLFPYGTTQLSRLAFHKALDDIAARESAGSSFSLRVLPQHFDRGLQLLAANELSPGLPAPAFGIVQQQTAREVAGELQSPFFLSQLALDGALYPPHDPILRHPTPQSVMGLKLADIEHYYRYAFRPDLTTIVVIGNIAPAEATAEVSKYFGAWRASGPKPPTDYAPTAANQPHFANVPDRSRVQDTVTLAETMGLNRFNPDYYALAMGNTVLGGGFYASRYYRDLRENGGLVYYVGSNMNVGRTRSTYSVNLGCDPPNVARARAIVIRDLHAMQAAPPSTEEMHQAKAQLLRQLPLSQGSVGSIAMGLLSRAITGLPLNEPEIAARRYYRMKAGEVQAAFRRWIRPDGLVQIVTGPPPQ